jgi:hypothetical protein
MQNGNAGAENGSENDKKIARGGAETQRAQPEDCAL